MKRKSRLNTKAVPDALKPLEPATLADYPELALATSSETQEEPADISDEEKGGIKSLIVGDVTISGDQLRTSPKNLKRLASSVSKVPDNAQDASVSPVKRTRPATMTTTTQEVMEAHAEAINILIDKGTQIHLDLAKACLKARDEVGRKSYNDFVPLLRMSKAEFSKYCAIGTKALLHDPDMRQHLPTSFSSLYVISMLDDDDLRRFVDETQITPRSTRSELEKLVPAKERNASKEIHSLPGPWFAAIELDPDCDDAIREAVHRALANLKSKIPAIVRVVDQIDLHEAERRRRDEREHQVFLKQLRVLVKKEVKHAGKTTRKGIHRNEEAKIGNDANEAQIRRALLTAGREGKYDELVEQAKREIALMDSPPTNEETLQTP